MEYEQIAHAMSCIPGEYIKLKIGNVVIACQVYS